MGGPLERPSHSLKFREAPVDAPQPSESASEGVADCPAETADPPDTRAAREPPPSTHKWGFGAFFLAWAVFLVVSVVVSATVNLHDPSERVGNGLLLALILPTLSAGVVAVVIPFVRGNGPVTDFRLRCSWEDLRAGLTIGAVGMVLTTVASVLWAKWIGDDQATSTVSRLLAGVRLRPAVAVVVFLHVWLVAPICEELLYRGLLWGAMERLRWSQTTVFVLTTAAFAIGHFEPERTVLLLVIALPIGLARMVTGRLAASVVAHQLNNFLPALGMLMISLHLMPS